MLSRLDSGSAIEVTARWRAMWNGEVLPFLRGLSLVQGRGILLRRGPAGTVVEAAPHAAGRGVPVRAAAQEAGPFALRLETAEDGAPLAVLLDSRHPEEDVAGYVRCGSHYLPVPKAVWPLAGVEGSQTVFVALEPDEEDPETYHARAGMGEEPPASTATNVVWRIGYARPDGDGGWTAGNSRAVGDLEVTGRWTT